MYLACNQHVSNMYLDYGNDYLSKDTCILHVTRMSLAFQIRLSLEAFLRYMYLICLHRDFVSWCKIFIVMRRVTDWDTRILLHTRI